MQEELSLIIFLDGEKEGGLTFGHLAEAGTVVGQVSREGAELARMVEKSLQAKLPGSRSKELDDVSETFRKFR